MNTDNKDKVNKKHNGYINSKIHSIYRYFTKTMNDDKVVCHNKNKMAYQHKNVSHSRNSGNSRNSGSGFHRFSGIHYK